MRKTITSLLLLSSILPLSVNSVNATNYYTSIIPIESSKVYKNRQDEINYKMLVRYVLLIWKTSEESLKIKSDIDNFDTSSLTENEKVFLNKVKMTLDEFFNTWFKWIESYQEWWEIDELYSKETKNLFWWKVSNSVQMNVLMWQLKYDSVVRTAFNNIESKKTEWISFPTVTEINSFFKLRYCSLINSWYSYQWQLSEFFNKFSCLSRDLWVFKEDNLENFDVLSFVRKYSNIENESVFIIKESTNPDLLVTAGTWSLLK